MKNIFLLLLLFTGIVKGQIINFPDANFKAKLLESGIARDLNNAVTLIDSNGNGEIEVNEAAQIISLNMSSSLISDATGIEYFINLQFLTCSGTQIPSLSFPGLSNLRWLFCENNSQLTSLNLSNLTNLNKLYCNYNKITTLDLSGLTFLNDVRCTYNSQLTSLNISNLPNLTRLECDRNQLSSLDATGLINLQELTCTFNSINSLVISGLTNLQSLNCYANQLTQLEVNTLSNLLYLDCQQNNLTSLAVNNLTNLQSLNCRVNQLTSIDISSLNNLRTFFCATNQITSLNINMLNNLRELSCGSNPIIELNISNLTNLTLIEFNSTQITSIDLNPFINLQSFSCANNSITNLDLSNLSQLQTLSCYYTQISSLDISHLSLLNFINFGNEELISVNMKNGNNETPNFFPSPNLQFICADESEINFMQNRLNQNGNVNTVLNSYCSFSPGGNKNTITGNLLFDDNNNGCDANDNANPYLKVNISDGTNSGATFTNNTGNYTFYTQAGDFIISPQVENQNYFNFLPPSSNIVFPIVDNSTQTQNFCITANGVHPDLEVVISPIRAARPGFDSEYKLVLKNKGNQTQSGTVNLTFDDASTDFVTATPNINNQTGNNLLWNFANLQPFETRVINLTLNINSPLEIPAVNSGDILDFIAIINPIESDETPLDNEFNFSQNVVNSYDPNDKTCLEGNVITPEDIGKYVHYNINFENVGTADAVNVVIKDLVDTTKFDVNTLQLLYASHPVETKIDGNKVEFIFENINLPPSISNPIGGHGNVLFKIKTLPTLLVGDQIANIANIYFDYNAPIETNEARSTFATLNNSNFVKDASITIAPNPAKNNVIVTSKGNIKSIELFDVQGRILQTILENKNTTTIDISNKSTGIYFLKVTTEIGSSVEKLVKEN